MAFISSAELLVLHGVRIKGMADTGSVARRFSLDRVTVKDLMLDHEARGWVRRAGFAGLTGWTLTEAGRDSGSRMLAVELDEAGVRDVMAGESRGEPPNCRLRTGGGGAGSGSLVSEYLGRRPGSAR